MTAAAVAQPRSRMKTVVVLPTYNERANIGRMLEELVQTFATMPAHDMHVLVVDDRSPDGTADVVRGFQRDHANVHLSEGSKAGLGAAYVRGMQHAMTQLGADVVIEMDADFSHSPSDIPRLVGTLEQGADFVIGSRYVPGGSIPENWGVLRRMNSRYGNLVARFIVGLHPVRDCTSGFRAIRTSLLATVKLGALKVQGYAFQVALLYEIRLRQARIVEIPISFVDRTAGSSKLGLRDIVEFLLNSVALRFRQFHTFIKFVIVGTSGVVVNLGAFTALLAAGINKYVASPCAIELSILTNFALHNWWTFRWRRTADTVHMRGLKFNIVSVLSLAVSFSTFVVLTQLFPSQPPQLHQFLGIVPATLVNYFLNSYWTFKDVRRDPQSR